MIYFGLIIGGLFTLGITMFIRPAKHFSENENRVLQQIPAFSLNSFVQGQYQEKLEKGADDQFPGRDGLTATASICKRMMGQKYIGDTYLGKDHYYLAKKTEDSIDMFRYMENLRYVERDMADFIEVRFNSHLDNPKSEIDDEVANLMSEYLEESISYTTAAL